MNNDWFELVLMLILIAIMIVCIVLVIAAIFAGPGFIILIAFGYEDVGFWSSAGAGLGTMFLIGTIGALLRR